MGLRMEPLVAWCLLAAAAAGSTSPVGLNELTGENGEGLLRSELWQLSAHSAVAAESEHSGEDDALAVGLQETDRADEDGRRSTTHGKSLKAGRAKGRRHGSHLRGRHHHKHHVKYPPKAADASAEADPKNASLAGKVQDGEGGGATFDVPLDSELQKHSKRQSKSLKVRRGKGKHFGSRRGKHGRKHGRGVPHLVKHSSKVADMSEEDAKAALANGNSLSGEAPKNASLSVHADDKAPKNASLSVHADDKGDKTFDVPLDSELQVVQGPEETPSLASVAVQVAKASTDEEGHRRYAMHGKSLKLRRGKRHGSRHGGRGSHKRGRHSHKHGHKGSHGIRKLTKVGKPPNNTALAGRKHRKTVSVPLDSELQVAAGAAADGDAGDDSWGSGEDDQGDGEEDTDEDEGDDASIEELEKTLESQLKAALGDENPVVTAPPAPKTVDVPLSSELQLTAASDKGN